MHLIAGFDIDLGVEDARALECKVDAQNTCHPSGLPDQEATDSGGVSGCFAPRALPVGHAEGGATELPVERDSGGEKCHFRVEAAPTAVGRLDNDRPLAVVAQL